MDPREAYQATVPQHAIAPPPQVPHPPPSSPRTMLAIVAGVVLILGIAIGVAIGHATSGAAPTPVVA